MKKVYKDLDKILKTSERVAILTHYIPNPDPDTVSSALLIRYILANHYKHLKIDVFMQGPMPNRIEELNFPYLKKISIVKDRKDIDFKKYTLVIMSDFNEVRRGLKGLTEDILKDTSIVVIDHHRGNPTKKAKVFINELRCSTVEQVFIIFREILKEKLVIDKTIATYVQIGIISDTGNLLYNSDYPETYKIMAEMINVHPVELLYLTDILYNLHI